MIILLLDSPQSQPHSVCSCRVTLAHSFSHFPVDIPHLKENNSPDADVLSQSSSPRQHHRDLLLPGFCGDTL